MASRDRVGAGVAGGNPQPLDLRWVGEAPADDLVEAEIAHRVLGATAQALLAAQAPDRAGGVGQSGRQVLVEAVDSPHLLDQVDLAGDVVVAVGRDLDRRGRRRATSTPKPSRSR